MRMRTSPAMCWAPGFTTPVRHMLLSSVSQMWKHRLRESKSLCEVSELLSDRVRTETGAVCLQSLHSTPLPCHDPVRGEKTCDLAGESSA